MAATPARSVPLPHGNRCIRDGGVVCTLTSVVSLQSRNQRGDMWKRARATVEDASKALETVVIFFILYSLLTCTVETLPGISKTAQSFLAGSDIVVSIFFAIEYILRLVFSPIKACKIQRCNQALWKSHGPRKGRACAVLYGRYYFGLPICRWNISLRARSTARQV